MSTYSSFVESSKAYERLFEILHKVFLVMTIVLVVLGRFVIGYFDKYLPYEKFDQFIAILYIMSPAIVTLVLTIASFIAARFARNIRQELPVDDKK